MALLTNEQWLYRASADPEPDPAPDPQANAEPLAEAEPQYVGDRPVISASLGRRPGYVVNPGYPQPRPTYGPG